MADIKFVNIIEAREELKEKVREWRNKDEVRRFMLTQHIISKEEHSGWLEGLRLRDDWKFWVVFLKDIPIGSMYLRNMNHEDLTSEWGFYIGEDAYKGRGLGKVMFLKLLEMFFDEMRFNVLFTRILSDNIIALDLYRKFKFREIKRSSFEDKREIVLLRFSKEDWVKYRRRLEDRAYSAGRK
ncbi:UDP-4-amino-4,6-dideoxy-N-acetyl-beta-L-altrosamine N-acetyltransferase [Candidatus Omnitrophota bacterium]